MNDQIKKIDGKLYRSLLCAGIDFLTVNKEKVNDLNVFPVPDGDTGTNMVVTLRSAYNSLASLDDSLDLLCRTFAYNVVLGARGNSGVIVSQFMKGASEALIGKDEAGIADIVEALIRGVASAYASVAKPVEGTILTVVREASDEVSKAFRCKKITSINELIDTFIEKAKISLEGTPELLPILKKANVVDSGGAGIVYFFEGVQKCLAGEEISVRNESESISSIDFSRFSTRSEFPFGYCTECLLQLTDDKGDPRSFDFDKFTKDLTAIGSSVAASLEGDKVKIHVHTQKPEEALAFIHSYGEFLTLKIENMSVQHDGIAVGSSASPSFCASNCAHKRIGAVAVSPDGSMDEIFRELGVDYILSGTKECAPCAEDFIRAYDAIDADRIIVFPNEKSNLLTVEQSISLSQRDDIFILDTKTPAECYAALTMFDCESKDFDSMFAFLRETIANVTVLTVAKAVKEATFGDEKIKAGDYISMKKEALIFCGDDLSEVLFETVIKITQEEEKEVVTFFSPKGADRHAIKEVQKRIRENNIYIDVGIIDTEGDGETLFISFE